MNFLKIRVILKRIKVIKFMMRDKSVKWYKKLLVGAGIVFLFLPMGMPLSLPLAIPVDIIIWMGILWLLKDELDKYWVGGKSVDYSKRFSSKNVIDADGYIVDDKEERK